VKYYAIPGNHETKWSESGVTDFGHIFGSERFAFEHGGVRFFGFNTGPVIRMMDGHISPADIDWLERELAALPEGQPVALITHYPLRDEDVDNWCDLTNVVRRYNIRAFIGGHYHSNRLFFYDGIPAFICRSNLRDAADSTGGYSVFDVAADSIAVYERKPGQALRRWGAYSFTERYFRPVPVDCKGYDMSVNTAYPQVREIWRTARQAAFYAAPTVHNGKVFAGDDNGVFSCYSLHDGSVQWQFAVGSRSRQSAVAVGSADATMNNTLPTANRPLPAATVTANRPLPTATATADRLLPTATADRILQLPTARIVGAAAVNDKAVVFGSADQYVYCLDPATGALRWKFAANRAVLGAATIDGNIVYIGTGTGSQQSAVGSCSRQC
jgi:hypothetical protein